MGLGTGVVFRKDGNVAGGRRWRWRWHAGLCGVGGACAALLCDCQRCLTLPAHRSQLRLPAACPHPAHTSSRHFPTLSPSRCSLAWLYSEMEAKLKRCPSLPHRCSRSRSHAACPHPIPTLFHTFPCPTAALRGCTARWRGTSSAALACRVAALSFTRFLPTTCHTHRPHLSTLKRSWSWSWTSASLLRSRSHAA